MQSEPSHDITAWRPRRIAVLRALQLGDMLCAVPALRALRAALPTTHVTLIGLPWAAEFAARFPRYVDDFEALPGFPEMPHPPANPDAFAEFLARMHARRFDLAIQMHGSGGATNALIELIGARRAAGYRLPGRFCPDPETFMPFPSGQPEIHRLLALMAFLGCPGLGDALEFPVRDADRGALEQIARATGLSRAPCAVLHPGARDGRRWPVERFAAVGDALARDGFQVAITGTPLESELTARLAALMREPCVNLGGATTLGALAALLESAALVVANDTGVAHLADALGAPSVVLVASSDLFRFGPLDRARHRALAPLQRIMPAHVLGEVATLLSDDAAHTASTGAW